MLAPTNVSIWIDVCMPGYIYNLVTDVYICSMIQAACSIKKINWCVVKSSVILQQWQSGHRQGPSIFMSLIIWGYSKENDVMWSRGDMGWKYAIVAERNWKWCAV